MKSICEFKQRKHPQNATQELCRNSRRRAEPSKRLFGEKKNDKHDELYNLEEIYCSTNRVLIHFLYQVVYAAF